MPDFARTRVMLIRKVAKRLDGKMVYRREPWDRVEIPGVGECFEPVDWTDGLTRYNTDKEYTGVEIIEGDLSQVVGFPMGGDVELPRN